MKATLRELAALVSPSSREPSACESCGGEFTCGATLAGCWCGEIKLSEATRDALRARFRGCLCRTCLERFAAGGAEARPSGRASAEG
jgi:hypothetical protein